MTRKANGQKVRKRGNGCGHLEKRRGVWLAMWMVNGKRFTRSTGTGDRKEAEKKLAEFVAPTQAQTEKERLENMAARIAGREAEIKAYRDKEPALALADAFTAYGRYLDAPDNPKRKARTVTLDRYEAQYGRLVDWLAAHYPEVTEFRHVSKTVARAFLADFQPKVSANTYNKHLTLYKRMWRVLAETARVDGPNPWESFQNREEDKSARRELTAEELLSVGRHVDGEMALLFAVGIYTGLRLWDAITLDWDAVDFARNHVTVYPNKTTKRDENGQPLTDPVVIPLVRPFRALLLAVPKAKRTGPLCPNLSEGYRSDAANTSKKIQRVFAECGIETHAGKGKAGRERVAVGFHSLRHTFVTVAAESGVPLATVQAVVGHTSPAMTKHYTHVREKAAQTHLQAFPDVFADGGAVAELPAPDDVVDVEAVTLPAGVSVELDAATAKAVDAIRLDGESRADAIRRAVESLARAK